LPCNRTLRRHERITQQFEYKEVITTGKVLVGKRFKAYILLDAVRARKAGFIAGRTVGGACERNRARRLLREAYRHLKPSTAPRGFLAVFVASRGIARAGLSEVENDMRGMLESCSLVRDIERAD
jgi:ribonuclease P protein component